MSTNKIITGLICGALCCIPAFAQNATGTASAADQAFVDFAGQTDMTEAHLGQVAQDQAAAQDIKDYGQMLSQDHTKDYDALTAVAGKIGATVPKAIDAAHIKMIEPIAKLKGKAFDHRFLEAMVRGHEEAIARYKKEAESGDNADLKAYANSALPTLQTHLDKAKELLKPAAGAHRKHAAA